MNTKEIGEIKRRVRRDRSNMQVVYGCYVGADKKIISDFKAGVGTMPENEAEKYFALFKKTLSGTLSVFYFGMPHRYIYYDRWMTSIKNQLFAAYFCHANNC